LAKDPINTDDILIRFQKDISSVFDVDVDAQYFQGNGQVNLSSFSSDGISLAINLQPYPKISESIGLKVITKTDGPYQLNLTQIVNIPRLFDIWLKDAYTKDSIDMRKHATYSFNVLKSDSNTFGSKRFTLVIRQNPAYTYQLLNFTATKITDSTRVHLAWDTENEQDYTNFTVERSTDNGLTFRVLDTVTSSGLGSYSFADKNPIIGQNIYKLKQEDFNNTTTYSDAVVVSFSDFREPPGGSLGLFPNPVLNQLNLVITPRPVEATSFQIRIFNISGFLVRQASSMQNNWQGDVGDLKPGTYIIKVSDLRDNSLVGNTKFVKL